MASKGSVGEWAHRGAKPDPAECDGQLDLKARFKDPSGRFKPVDLSRPALRHRMGPARPR
jgi:hypothetical protein